MVRFDFWQVFKEERPGVLTPVRLVKIAGAVLGPGVMFTNGVSFGGVNIFDYYGYPVEADEVDGVLIIRAFYVSTVQ